MVGRPDVGALKAKVDVFQQRRPWRAFPVAVLLKFGEDSTANLAVVISYYAFFSVFPLLLALASGLGFVLHGHPSWQTKIEGSALQNLPLVKGSPLPHHGSLVVVLFGALLALYSGLGVAKAAQHACDVIYGVARDERPSWLAANARALRTVVVGGFGLIASTLVAGTVTSGHSVGISVGWGLTVLGVVVTTALNTALLVVLLRWFTSRELTARDVLPGATFAAVALALLQALASAVISHKLQHVSSTYGSFGTVIVLLSWFFLQAQVLLAAVQVNVVRQDRLWPRSLSSADQDTSVDPEAD